MELYSIAITAVANLGYASFIWIFKNETIAGALSQQLFLATIGLNRNSRLTAATFN